jgi:hypothetical protein
MGVGGQRYAPAALAPGKGRYPLCRRLDGLKAGMDGRGKSRPPPHRDLIPGPSNHSESIYLSRPSDVTDTEFYPMRKKNVGVISKNFTYAH